MVRDSTQCNMKRRLKLSYNILMFAVAAALYSQKVTFMPSLAPRKRGNEQSNY